MEFSDVRVNAKKWILTTATKNFHPPPPPPETTSLPLSLSLSPSEGRNENSPTHESFQLYAKSMSMTCCTTTKISAPARLRWRNMPRNHGSFETNIETNTDRR